MSDLDADLYGDLYGNDETDYNEQAENETATHANAESIDAHSSSTPKSTEHVSTTPPKTSAIATFEAVKSVAPTAESNKPQPISTYNPPTQQIPTYEQPSPLRESARPDSGFQNIPVNERSVRPSEMKDEGKMFIGGLNWDTTDDTLRDYFSQFGKVDACTIMRDAAGRSRCFAFLTFDDPASVNAVMVREHILDGKIIDPKRAIPRQEHQRATKLFIGGLAGTVTSESMREFFSQFGKVIDSTVMLDRETGRSKGFGFVSFEGVDVTPFLGFGNLEIDGKLIDVKLAQPRYQRDQFLEDGSEGTVAGAGAGAGTGAGAAGNFGQGQVHGNARFNAAGGAGAGAGAGYGGGAAGMGAVNPMANMASALANMANMNGGAAGAGGGGVNGAGAGAGFDPQALAALYTRMFQLANGAMNPAMMGMGAMGGMGAAGMGAMGGGMGGAMGMGRGGMMGGGMNMGGRGGMMGGGAGGAGGMGGHIPRGPRGASAGPTQDPRTAGQAASGGAPGVGPQRSGQRGQHSFHPYAR